MLVGFLAALKAEEITFKEKKGLLFNGDTYIVERCGVGEEAKAKALQLIEDGCELLVGWGVAGGAEPNLRNGDLVVTSDFKNELDLEFHFDSNLAEMIDRKLHELKPRSGPILTVKTMVLKPEEKKLLADKYRISVLDMESTIIAQVAEKAAIPYLCIRAICDELDTDIPLFVNESLNKKGEPAFCTLLYNLLREPSQLISMIKLGWKFRIALNTLRDTARLLTK